MDKAQCFDDKSYSVQECDATGDDKRTERRVHKKINSGEQNNRKSDIVYQYKIQSSEGTNK